MKDELETLLQELEDAGLRGRFNPSALFSAPDDVKYLGTVRLAELENTFRQWAEGAARKDVRLSRKRILLIFLMIRHTGARLGEILALDDGRHIDLKNLNVRLGHGEKKGDTLLREVQIPPELGQELEEALKRPEFAALRGTLFRIDPGHVRRKFYEQAEACGLPRTLGNPNTIRKSRAIELLQSNLPLPVVQKILGHSTAGLTASYLDISPEDLRQVARHFIDRESRRKSSARNTFFGKIIRIRSGDIQSEVEMATLSGDRLVSVITNESRDRLQLRENTFVSAEIKAPWVIIAKSGEMPRTSARNTLRGRVARIIRGRITTEFVVTLADGTEVCSLVTEKSRQRLALKEDEAVWVMFDAFSVILNTD